MNKTKISWTNQTWNPVTGCSRVSEGCRHCYAERMDKRIRAARGEEWKEWSAQNAAYNVRLHPERLEQPLHWKKPRMVFVNSMSDLFHELVPFEFIDQVFVTMFKAKVHTFQVLTKRPARMLEYIRRTQVYLISLADEPLPNVWLGVSVENQKAADERIPLLLQTPAVVRFLSCEPLLEKINLSDWLEQPSWEYEDDGKRAFTQTPDWVICGGESGPHYREMNLDWARSIRDQCVAANVPFFFKQSSAYRNETGTTLDGVEWHQFPKAGQLELGA